MLKKLLSLILAVLMVLTVFAGCSKGNVAEPEESKESEASVKEEEGGEVTQSAGSEDPVPILIYCADFVSLQYPMTMETPNIAAIAQIFLEKYNAQISIEPVIADRMEELVNTRLAGGDRLPDIISYGFSQERLVDLYKTGTIIRLNDLISEYAPEIEKKMVEENPYMTMLNADNDGNILKVPRYQGNIQHQLQTIDINYTWLKKLGLELPETTDELYEALRAFRDNDMNGDGTANEVLFPYYESLNMALSGAFGVPKMSSANGSWWVDDSGKVYHTMLTPEAREYVAFVAKMYAEGLIDAEFLNATGEARNAKLYSEKVAGTSGNWWMGAVNTLAMGGNGLEDEYVPLGTLTGPNGDCGVALINLGGSGGSVITKDCQSPETAMKLFNYGYTTDGYEMYYYGRTETFPNEYYDISYDIPEDLPMDDPYYYKYSEYGQKELSSEIGIDLWNKIGTNLEILPYYNRWSVSRVAFQCEIDGMPEYCEVMSNYKYYYEKLTEIEDVTGKNDIVFASPTDGQITAYEQYSDLMLFIDEGIQNFMTGKEPMDKWDEFVESCKNMGIDEAAAIMQERYDSADAVLAKFS